MEVAIGLRNPFGRFFSSYIFFFFCIFCVSRFINKAYHLQKKIIFCILVFQILSKLKKASPGGHINSEKVEVSIPKVSHISHHQEETLAYDAIRNANHGDDVLTKTNVSQEMMAMDISLVTPIPILRYTA